MPNSDRFGVPARWNLALDPAHKNLDAIALDILSGRGGPIAGKYFLKLTGPHSEWTLARFSDTFPLTTHTLPEHVFTTIEDAEFFVFRRRWEEMFGADPGAGS